MNTLLDQVLLGAIVLSVVISFWRGFVAELLSLLSWGGMVVMFLMGWEPAAAWLLSHHVAAPWHWVLSAASILLGIWIMVRVLTGMLHGLFRRLHMLWLDRLLGLGFGMLRGMLLAYILFSAAVLILGEGHPLILASASPAWIKGVFAYVPSQWPSHMGLWMQQSGLSAAFAWLTEAPALIP